MNNSISTASDSILHKFSDKELLPFKFCLELQQAINAKYVIDDYMSNKIAQKVLKEEKHTFCEEYQPQNIFDMKIIMLASIVYDAKQIFSLPIHDTALSILSKSASSNVQLYINEQFIKKYIIN